MTQITTFHDGHAFRVAAQFEDQPGTIEQVVYNGQFASEGDAIRYAGRVSNATTAFRIGQSLAFVFNRAYWNYTASAFANRLGTAGEDFVVPATA